MQIVVGATVVIKGREQRGTVAKVDGQYVWVKWYRFASPRRYTIGQIAVVA